MDTLKDTIHLNSQLDTKVSPLPQDALSVPTSNQCSDNNILNIYAYEKIEKITRLLSDRNLRLLTIIGTQKPKTLAELSRISGRPKASLTRTLARLAHHGIIILSKSKGRGKTPTLACQQLRLNINLLLQNPLIK